MKGADLLGRKVKDKITGFAGVVTGYCMYITGRNQALVVPPIKDDGSHVDALWIDEQRLEVQGGDRITLDNGDTPGCDIPAPKR